MDDMTGFGAAVLVPIFGMLFLFGFPLAAWVFFRMLAHRERIAMIRSGIAPQPGLRGASWGGVKGYTTNAGAQPQGVNVGNCSDPRYLLRRGITLAFIGFALTIGLSFIGWGDGVWRPGPWLLGGLIPMFIGLAQVTTAFLTDPELFGMLAGRGGAAGPRPFAPSNADPAPSDGPSMPSPPQYDTSYTYRPGERQELRPPTPPPERRP